MRIWPLVLPIVLAATPALALEPARHRSIAEKACADAGLPSAFCRRMGQEVYQTDYREWTDLHAHAQRELGEDRCTAADAAQARVDRLARDVVAKLRGLDYEAGAVALGRAIHTLQDECAHHGMTNQEHAYYSLTQTCEHQDVSPDVQPEAITCATVRTRDAFVAVAAALQGQRWDYVDNICREYGGDTDRDSCQSASLPTPGMACDFLAEHDNWDGEDSRWNGDRVGPALLAAFQGGLRGDALPAPLRASDDKALDPPAPRAYVDDREAGCTAIDVGCLGKVDDPGTADQQSGGCSSGRGMPGMLVLLALIGCRRRAMLRR